MNYADPVLLTPLAERYVLGTMSRRARRRFGELVDRDKAIADGVYQLEATFLPMAWSLLPVTPSQLIWPKIAKQAGLSGKGPRHTASEQRRPPWQAVAASMALAFFVTAVGWWQESIKPPEVVVETVVESVPLEPSIGVVAGADGQALWIARIYDDLRRADVSVSNLPPQYDANDYELWILRDDGVPVSLGLLPQSGDRSLTLADNALDALQRGSTLAVSLEPPGGSPQATPTGPVLFTAVLLAP